MNRGYHIKDKTEPRFLHTEEKARSEDCENCVHCVMLGDALVGKTCLTLSYTQSIFPDHYIATVLDRYPVPLKVGGEKFVIRLFDTAGQNDYESVRAKMYDSSDVLVVCFAVCDRQSFYNVLSSWLPEICRHTKQKRPLVLVGTQTDLRSSSSSPSSRDQVSSKEGSHLAKVIGADCYIECSARSQQGLQQVFEHIIFAALKNRKKKSSILHKLLKF